jgi:hypothetical protein
MKGRMMVSIRENWSEITGVVRSISSAPDLKDYMVAQVQVEQVRDVEGFANLLADTVGTELAIYIPADLISTHPLTPGMRITWRVRRGGPHKVFVLRDHFLPSS